MVIFFEGTDDLVWDNPYLILERAGLKLELLVFMENLLSMTTISILK